MLRRIAAQTCILIDRRVPSSYLSGETRGGTAVLRLSGSATWGLSAVAIKSDNLLALLVSSKFASRTTDEASSACKPFVTRFSMSTAMPLPIFVPA